MSPRALWHCEWSLKYNLPFKFSSGCDMWTLFLWGTCCDYGLACSLLMGSGCPEVSILVGQGGSTKRRESDPHSSVPRVVPVAECLLVKGSPSG